MASEARYTLGISIVPASPFKLAYVLVRGDGRASSFKFEETFLYPEGLAKFLTKGFAPFEVDAFLDQLDKKTGVILLLDELKASAFGFL